jgi:hypothetical protein
MARRLDNRATLEHPTAKYFRSLDSGVAAEESDLENALSAASQEIDFDHSKRGSPAWRNLDRGAAESTHAPLGAGGVSRLAESERTG